MTTSPSMLPRPPAAARWSHGRSIPGERLTWRLAGIERAAAEPLLPFLIEWGEGVRHPSRVLGDEGNDSVAIIRLGLTGDAEWLYAWLEDDGGPIAVDAGRPGLREVVLWTPDGEVRIDETFC